MKKQVITTDTKKILHNVAVNCIMNDEHPFDDFRRERMKKFLSVAILDCLGPHTVKKFCRFENAEKGF